MWHANGSRLSEKETEEKEYERKISVKFCQSLATLSPQNMTHKLFCFAGVTFQGSRSSLWGSVHCVRQAGWQCSLHTPWRFCLHSNNRLLTGINSWGTVFCSCFVELLSTFQHQTVNWNQLYGGSSLHNHFIHHLNQAYTLKVLLRNTVKRSLVSTVFWFILSAVVLVTASKH